jgi:hypothetical protein
LGLVRLATWQVPAFREAVEKLIEQHGGFDEMVTTEFDSGGGEKLTDVLVKFSSEEKAELVKDEIDGEIVAGRKVQVKFT